MCVGRIIPCEGRLVCVRERISMCMRVVRAGVRGLNGLRVVRYVRKMSPVVFRLNFEIIYQEM